MNKKKRISKNDIKTAKRLLKCVTETYKFRFVLVFICILISSVASISVSLSLKFMLDDYIIPLIGSRIRITQNCIRHLVCWHAFSSPECWRHSHTQD